MEKNEIIAEYEHQTRKALGLLVENKNLFDEKSLIYLMDCNEDNIREFKSVNWDERSEEDIESDRLESLGCDKYHADKEDGL